MTFFKKKDLRKAKKASAFIWLLAMIGIFFVGMVYVINVKAYGDVFVKVNETINNSNFDAQPTLNKVNNVIRIWPIILILGLVLWAIVASVRQSPENLPPP